MTDPTIAGVAGAFASIIKSVQAVMDLSASVEVKAKLTELYGLIIAGQQSALESIIKQQAMLDEINQLKEELARVKAWEEQKQRYKLVHPVQGTMSLVYALKESCKGTEPPHWICTKCYDDGRRTVVQPQLDEVRYVRIVCPTCKSEIHTGVRGLHPPTYAPA